MRITKSSLKLSILIIFLPFMSCGSNDKTSLTNLSMAALSEAPVVAKRVCAGSDSIISVTLNDQPSKVTVLASDMLDDLRLIKLENSKEAMIGDGSVWTDGNRLLIYDGNVIKQFAMDGKYIGTIGKKGNGPGEYTIAPYSIYIDNESNRISMLQYGAKNIICYDTLGNFIENIPLAHEAKKGFIKVDMPEKKVTIARLLFNDEDSDDVIWTQDLDGNILSSVKHPSVSVIPDFSNEVNGGMTKGNDQFNYSLFNIETKQDTLYRYNKGRLIPEFTVDFKGEIPPHQYLSFPDFYLITTYEEPEMVTENSYIFPANTPFLIDKKSLRGAPADIMLDNIGTVTIGSGWEYQKNPVFFVISYDPGTLLEMIENAPAEHPIATPEIIDKMKQLKETIDPDDNNYIIFGKWKRG